MIVVWFSKEQLLWFCWKLCSWQESSIFSPSFHVIALQERVKILQRYARWNPIQERDRPNFHKVFHSLGQGFPQGFPQANPLRFWTNVLYEVTASGLSGSTEEAAFMNEEQAKMKHNHACQWKQVTPALIDTPNTKTVFLGSTCSLFF